MRKFLITMLVFVFILVTGVTVAFANEELEDTEIKVTNKIPDDAGTYFYRLYSTDSHGARIEKIIKVTITLPHTIIDEESEEGINAYDFKLNKGIMRTLTSEDLIRYGQARAWDTKTGKSIPIATVKTKNIDDTLFEVTYSTHKGTSTTVQVMEFEHDVLELEKTFMRFDEEYSFFERSLSLLMIIISILSSILAIIAMYICFNEFKKTQEVVYKRKPKR